MSRSINIRNLLLCLVAINPSFSQLTHLLSLSSSISSHHCDNHSVPMPRKDSMQSISKRTRSKIKLISEAQLSGTMTPSTEAGGQSFASDEARGGNAINIASTPRVDNRQVIRKAVKPKHRIGAPISKSSVLAAPVDSSEVGNNEGYSIDDDREPHGEEYPASQDGMSCVKQKDSAVATTDEATTDNLCSIVESNYAMDEECATAFHELWQKIESNISGINKASAIRVRIMLLHQEKTAENASLSNEIIELSEKQALKSKVLTNELGNSRTLKRETIRIEINSDDVDLNEQVANGGNRAAETGRTTSVQLTATSTEIAPEPFVEAVSGSSTVTPVGEAVSKVIPHQFEEDTAGTAGSAVFLHQLVLPFLSTLAKVKAATGR
jgi:hypothetical protein